MRDRLWVGATLAVFAVSGCGSESGESGPRFDCAPSDRTGLYAAEYVETDGNCGPLAPEVSRLKDSYPDPPAPNCLILSEQWQESACTLVRSADCTTPDGHIEITATSTQQDDFGGTITGTVHAKIYGKNAYVCESDYAVTLVRQSG